MTITVLSDVILPNSVLTAGVRGKNMRRNTRVVNQAGYGTINVDWTRTLRQYELGTVPMLPSAWQDIEGLHEVTEGGAYGFLMQDPKDASASAAPLQPLQAGASVGTAGYGYGVPSYQLYKRYTSAGSTRTKDRKITRPKAALALLKAGLAVVLGSAAGQASINTLTGVVTFVSSASSNVSAVTVGANTVVTLSSALSSMAIGGRLWLDGLAGADAALLNGASHQITAITGAAYTLATSTAGKAITAAGQGHKYPQPSESLSWSGGFYVPVHFASDEIDWELVCGGPADTRLLAGPSVLLQEIRE